MARVRWIDSLGQFVGRKCWGSFLTPTYGPHNRASRNQRPRTLTDPLAFKTAATTGKTPLQASFATPSPANTSFRCGDPLPPGLVAPEI